MQLHELESLAAAGAAQLAASLYDTYQPDVNDDPRGWMAWERSRVAILERQEEWAAINMVLSELPASLPDGFRDWAATHRALALLKQGASAQARQLLAERIWQGSDLSRLKTWRELIIQSYLTEGRYADAYAAMLRYRQDYGNGGREEALMRARVLLANERPADVEQELQVWKQTPEAQALILLARLRSGTPALEVLSGVNKLLEGKEMPFAARQLLWGVQAETRQKLDDYSGVAQALEKVWSQSILTDSYRDLFGNTSDPLWEAYLDYARGIGNEKQLLIGDDEAWLTLAQTESDFYPVRTRSLYALLGSEARNDRIRQEAHRKLVGRILGLEEGSAILKALYLRSQRFASAESLPMPVRTALADRAIETGNLEEAAVLLESVEQAPADADAMAWQLRRIRVFLYTGRTEQAIVALTRLIGQETLPDGALDRIIQVVFDVQTIGLHNEAIVLFEALSQRSRDMTVKRELLYWIADSYKAQGKLADASRLYMESATMPGAGAMDPWAQTARFQAAKTLAKAGFTDDARVLLRQLLAATRDPKRQAVLRQELEQLILVDKEVVE